MEVLIEKLTDFNQLCEYFFMIEYYDRMAARHELDDEFSKVDASYVLDIHPARELQEDYPDITSDIILNELSNGEYISLDDAHKFKDIKNSVILFMSPNDLSGFEKEVIEVLENRK